MASQWATRKCLQVVVVVVVILVGEPGFVGFALCGWLDQLNNIAAFLDESINQSIRAGCVANAEPLVSG